jgi:nucleoside-diphosphate-sugar epimerase
VRVLVIGATGTIGAAVADALEPEHEVVRASRRSSPPVDLADRPTIGALFAAVPDVDARGLRLTVVSPGWVSESLVELGMDPSSGTPVAAVARSYVSAVQGSAQGATLTP